MKALYGVGLKIPRKYNSIQFLQQLTEEDRYFVEQQSTNSGQIFSIIPPTGTTTYFTGLVVHNRDDTDSINVIVRQTAPRIGTTEVRTIQPDTTQQFTFPIIRVVGNGITELQVFQQGSPQSVDATLWGWNENTARIP